MRGRLREARTLDALPSGLRAAIEQAGKWLQQAGYVVEQATPPMLPEKLLKYS